MREFHPCRRAWLLRGGLAAAVAWSVSSQAPGEGVLQVEIRDQATGNAVPAMVCITSLTDRRWRTPPDGGSSPPFSTTRDFYSPGPWKPGEIGPVRVTNGDYRNNEIRSFSYEGASDYPFWREPASYFVSRPFSIRLPAGKWRLAVARGLEYLPVFEEFEIRPRQVRARKIRLARWVDMPKLGWYSGDDHVHFPRTRPEHNAFLLTWAKAEDVHVVNVLRMGDVKATYFEQPGYGKPFEQAEGNYVLVPGQEDPRAQLGHAIALHITSPVRDVSRYHLYDHMFVGARAQGGLTGYAHLAWSHPWDVNINAVRGMVDFFEILQFRHLGFEDYYDFLNLGIRLTASAGSDLPWGNTIGEARVYARTGPVFSPEAWFAALKRGSTFVTNGPMLTLTVNGAQPGEEMRAQQNDDLRIAAHAWAPEPIGTPRLLEIVSQGRVIRASESHEARRSHLRAEFTLRATASGWIAARVTTQNGGMAHTSPVYIVVDNVREPHGGEVRLAAASRTRLLDDLVARLRDPKLTRGFGSREADLLLERIAEARSRYKELSSGAK